MGTSATNSSKIMPVPAETTSPAAASTQSLLCGFLRAYLGLATEQVVVYNQKWKIPPDKRLYVTVSSIGPQKSYGATSSTEASVDGKALIESVAIASREMISVDLYSRSQEAINRKEEILQALASIPMQQLCEQYAIKVARIPLTFVDTSGLEATANLNRFSITFAVLRTRVLSKPVEYYDTFSKPSLVIEP